ncbi:MAG: OB-fold nucleic acid binding domain-containing protein [candidate division KSB1 bacterium]|nr:OB-fold nucleic acid binding domain-containing protein [candidate division KSB1 bacterium]
MAATISSEMGNTDRVTILIEESRRMGLNVLLPDVNESYTDFVVTDSGLRFGLGAVKNVGYGTIDSIVNARKEGGRFETLFDLAKRMNGNGLNRKVLESLTEAGALDSLAGNRAEKHSAVEAALGFASKLRNGQKDRAQGSLFDMSDEALEVSEPELESKKDWTDNEKLEREKNVLGFYLSGHPLDEFREQIDAFSTVKLDQAFNLREKTSVRICGMITHLKNHIDSKNRRMAFFSVQDLTGSMEGLAFADTYSSYQEYLQEDKVIVITGKINKKENSDAKIIVDSVTSLDEARERFTKNLCLNVNTTDMTEHHVDQLLDVFEKNSGNVPVYFNIKVPETGAFLVRSRVYQINPNLEILTQLRNIVGRENVWIGS